VPSPAAGTMTKTFIGAISIVQDVGFAPNGSLVQNLVDCPVDQP
jgi:hypothetical protein